MKCKLCIEQGWPANYGDEPECAFATGEFVENNWACATACEIRTLMGEGEDEQNEDAFYVRRDDQSYGALWVPPHPDDEEDVGCWRGGGMIVATWYKSRGRTDTMIRVDGRDGGLERAKPLLLAEAEAAIRNIRAWKEKTQDTPTSGAKRGAQS